MVLNLISRNEYTNIRIAIGTVSQSTGGELRLWHDRKMSYPGKGLVAPVNRINLDIQYQRIIAKRFELYLNHYLAVAIKVEASNSHRDSVLSYSVENHRYRVKKIETSLLYCSSKFLSQDRLSDFPSIIDEW